MAQEHPWEVGEGWEERQVKGWGVGSCSRQKTPGRHLGHFCPKLMVVGQALGSCTSCW